MRGYFGLGQLSATEKSDILNQHKSVYNGYQTMQPQVSNTQPLTVYDFAGDKEGLVVNNKGEVKKYTNMGINEQVETKEVCDDCGAMIMDGVCTECNYGHMEESEHYEGEMCEQCGGTMKENVCEQCGSGTMEEEVGHLDDIYNVKDLNLKKGDYDYVEGGGNDYGTFEGMHKNLYKEQDDMDYESSYTEVTDGEVYEIDIKDLIKGKKYRYKSPSHQDDVEFGDEQEYRDGGNMYGFKGGDTGYALDKKSVEDLINDLNDDSELYEQGGNADDMDVDDVASAYDFVSDGPGGVYPVNELDEDDMYGYEPKKEYETMESAWADDEVEEELDEIDVSGVQGIYGAMKKAYDFDSKGPGKAGPYQRFSYNEEDDFEEIDEDLKESFIIQKNKINEMFNRFKKYN